jgi:hypothetical protein
MHQGDGVLNVRCPLQKIKLGFVMRRLAVRYVRHRNSVTALPELEDTYDNILEKKERNRGNPAVGERDVGILVTADTESTLRVSQQKLFFWRSMFGKKVTSYPGQN